jgi:hypothetical protein
MVWPTWSDIGILVAVLAGVYNARQIQNVHLSLNSRLDQWKDQTAERIIAAHALGRQDERDSMKQRGL